MALLGLDIQAEVKTPYSMSACKCNSHVFGKARQGSFISMAYFSNKCFKWWKHKTIKLKRGTLQWNNKKSKETLVYGLKLKF